MTSRMRCSGTTGNHGASTKGPALPPALLKTLSVRPRLLHGADLSQQRCGVEVAHPPLRLAVLVIDDERHWNLDRLVRRGDTGQLAAMRPRHGALADDDVPFGDDAIDAVIDVGQAAHSPSWKLWKSARSVVPAIGLTNVTSSL